MYNQRAEEKQIYFDVERLINKMKLRKQLNTIDVFHIIKGDKYLEGF